MNDRPIRVLVADDSSTARALVRALLEGDPDMVVVGEATNGQEAVELAAELQPTVIVMDIEMPVLDGLEATKRIMIDTPTPIVIVTGSTDPRDVGTSLQAVRLGALTVLPKPPGPGSPTFERDSRRLVSLVKAFAEVKVVRRRFARVERDAAAPPPPQPAPPARELRASIRVIAIGASTGGPPALYRLLEGLPPELNVPLLVVQHIAPGFVAGLVNWLRTGTALPVKMAEHGELLESGVVYVAPDDAHLEVSGDRRVRLSNAPPEGGFRPSATRLFASVAECYGAGAAAVVLTGMGNDGLEGARAVRAAHGVVMAQDEESSVVFGMPKAIVNAGLADTVGPVDKLARTLVLRAPMREGHR